MLSKTIQGHTIPALGFGTWPLTGAACRDAVQRVLDLGYRHIDTAQMYENEDAVGAGLRASSVDRDDVFLTTKLWYDSLDPARVPAVIEERLRRLKVDVLDLLLIHWPNPEVELAGTLDAMRRAQDDGKVRHLGVSNFPVALLKEARTHASILCNQVEYHPFLGQQKLLSYAETHDVLVTAYRPLAKGQLDHPVLRRVAKAHGVQPAQVALRWLLQQPQVAAIPKAASPAHQKENLDLDGFTLTEEEMQEIHNLDAQERFVDPAFAPAWD